MFLSPSAVNGMLTSHCDNRSTHHYHLTYHPCFDTQFRHDRTTQQYFRAVSTDHIDQRQFVLFPIQFITILTQLLASRQALLPFVFLFPWSQWQLPSLAHSALHLIPGGSPGYFFPPFHFFWHF